MSRKLPPGNPWTEFEGRSYEIIDLGREAVFYIPINKLRGNRGIRIRQDLHLFLMSQFGAYSTSPFKGLATYGYWTDPSKSVVYDESMIFRVAFVGKEKIPTLFERIAQLATEIEEDCIYVQAGQYSGLVRPKR